MSMRFFLNPISISDEGKSIIFFLNATIVVVIFFIMLGLTVHIYKKHKNEMDGSEDNKAKRNFISLIIAEGLLLAFIIIFLTAFD